jgi:hypothetical protein
MIWFLLILVFIGFLLFRLGLSEVKRRDEKQLKINQLFKDIGFNPTKIFTSENKNSTIAYDRDSNTFALVTVIGNEQLLKKFNGEDIIQSEIVEDNFSVTRASRSSQIGGAIVGGALTGGVGAIIGGVTGKRIEKKEVKSIELKIVINDVDDPVKKVTFLNRDYPIEKSNPIYKHYYNEIDNWQNMMKVIIKQSNQLNSN